MVSTVGNSIKSILSEKLIELSDLLNGDIFTFYGQIFDGLENEILKIIEEIADQEDKSDKLFVILTTGGGSATAVERYVNILRHHYDEVNFIVPDYADSAGTIFGMSGDQIYMDYVSGVGPIDRQIRTKDGNWVAALGYLDKINELIEKANNNTISQAEFLILREFDLAELKGYEQAKELTISLLKKWLVNFKFKNWSTHRTHPILKGTEVTEVQKEARAEEIADMLSDNNRWKSHGRPINIDTLEKELKLEIHDYSKQHDLRNSIREYYDLLSDFLRSNNVQNFMQTKLYI